MKRSKQSLSNYKLGSCNMGELIPINCMEVLPGDTIQQATSLLVRCTPLVAPVMHPVHVKIHHWFVPNRLVWDDWEDFITGGPDNDDPATFPTIDLSSAAVGSLADYFGVPTGSTNTDAINALPFRAYSLIWNEWYRDQDLQTALTIDTTDGVDSTTNTTLQNVCWEKDRFTIARDSTQEGSAVSLPLGTEASVFGDNMDFDATDDSGNRVQVYDSPGGTLRLLRADQTGVYGDNATSGTGVLKADLTNATAATINQLREALGLQRFAEARAIYGSRYSEYLRYLGVNPQDSRLDRPEYLGGGKQTIQFSEVLQTGVDSTDDGLGNLGGHGIAALRSNRYRKFFPEHGYVISLLSIRPKAIYGNGLPKMWSKTTKEEFWQKELQFIGQQEIYNKEVYIGDSAPNDVFGYGNRYDDYRHIQSSISGDFRAAAYQPWHLARIFSSDVALNSSFVTCSPATDIFASTSSDTLLFMASHSIQARRPVAKVGNPGAIF
jgi:hypothetical protein